MFRILLLFLFLPSCVAHDDVLAVRVLDESALIQVNAFTLFGPEVEDYTVPFVGGTENELAVPGVVEWHCIARRQNPMGTDWGHWNAQSDTEIGSVLTSGVLRCLEEQAKDAIHVLYTERPIVAFAPRGYWIAAAPATGLEAVSGFGIRSSAARWPSGWDGTQMRWNEAVASGLIECARFNLTTGAKFTVPCGDPNSNYLVPLVGAATFLRQDE